MNEQFQYLVRISTKRIQSYFMDNPSLPIISNQEESQSSEDEFITTFVPCPSPFLIPC